MSSSRSFHQEPSGLLTDLYQLTMLDSYLDWGMKEEAVFEFFVRRLPPTRGFLMAAGLEQVLEYLGGLSFVHDELEWLAATGKVSQRLIDYLADFRFCGDVHAMREGTIFFANEPILRVTAPLPQAQLVETRIINLLHLQTVIASKAARFVLAAPDSTLVDFGLRRAHGAEAGLLAARAAYLAGFSGTATVLANRAFQIPLYGTMAHSFVQAHESELEAFEHFARTHRDAVLLIDTYDTLLGAERAAQVAHALRPDGIKIRGVRLDSGDLPKLALQVREILDRGGCDDIAIFCSGGIDEYALAREFGAKVPADGFGIGTHLDVSADAPYLDCAYKLQEYAGIPRRKRSLGKATWPGRKQVYRRFNTTGKMLSDSITLDNRPGGGQALLKPVMRSGRRLNSGPSLEAVRRYAAKGLAAMPANLKTTDGPYGYKVDISSGLQELADRIDRKVDSSRIVPMRA